jgi:hypothetical protein
MMCLFPFPGGVILYIFGTNMEMFLCTADICSLEEGRACLTSRLLGQSMSFGDYSTRNGRYSMSLRA